MPHSRSCCVNLVAIAGGEKEVRLAERVGHALASHHPLRQLLLEPAPSHDVDRLHAWLHSEAHQTPDGWPEDSSEWVSSGALIARLNYALALTGGEIFDVQAPPAALLEGVNGDNAHAVLDRLLEKLLGGQFSDSTRATLEKQLPAPGTPPNAAKLCALILGSPEFQKR